MAQVKELIQQHIGSGPIVKALLQKMDVISIIDRNLPMDPRRLGPTHGETVVGMVACLAQGICALYRMEQFAHEEPLLEMLFPQYKPKAWHDDHLGDTLDAIWEFGPGALQGAVTTHLVATFGVRVDQIHYDTTSFKVFGRYEEPYESAKPTDHDTSPAEAPPARLPVRLALGHSKDHRPDLKQVKGGLAVSSDGSFPLIFQAQDGNRADVSTYINYWLQVKDIVGRTDFLFVGDCKLAAQDNLITIMKHQGRFLAPLPSYAGIERQVEEWVLSNTVEERLPWRDAAGKVVWYRGFCRPLTLACSEGKHYPCQVHLVFSPPLQAEKQANLERRLQKTRTFLEELPHRLGKRDLKSQEAIEQAIMSTLKRYRTEEFVTYRIVSTETRHKRYLGRGRPGPQTPYEKVSQVQFSLQWQENPSAIDKANLLGGYFPLITCDLELTTANALSIYKAQYQPEQRFKWLKGASILAPVLLKKPTRIEAFFFIVGLVLQLFTLVEREAARQIAQSGEPVIGLKPNHVPDYRPKTEAMLNAFCHMNVTTAVLVNDPAEIIVSPLNPLQKRLLHLIGLDESIYTLDYLNRPLVEEINSS
jgi:transposase